MATKTKVAAQALTNAEWWNIARSKSPTFASHTSEGTADMFTERGYGELTRTGINIINEFWDIVMPYALQLVNISHAKDPLAEADVGETFTEEYGEVIQRLATQSVKPVSPAYRNLKDGDSPDPFVVRRPEVKDRYFSTNYDYQSLITMPDDWQTKRIFSSEYGVSAFVAGVLEGLQNGWVIQNYENKMECINAAINRGSLTPTQKVNVELPPNPTEEQIIAFLLQVSDVVTNMTVDAQTSAYNELGFASVQDKSRLRLLVRAGYKNRVRLIARRNTYNPDDLNLDIEVVEVPHFGGLVPYADAELTTLAYPVYGPLGDVIGFNQTEGASEVTIEADAVYYKDTNAEVVAVLADKGFIFATLRNPYRVEPIRNPRGLYVNMWASAPGNSINYDRLYNMVVFSNNS